MRILMTNDDGVHAQGLAVLERIARALADEVWIVAPEYDQSGVAHSLSLNDPLRLREVGERHYAVRGTPTDCVIMGVRHLMKDARPDLILSGVNRGQNVAEDVTYSGTIAGAMEGTILGVPSIALSQAYGPGGRAQVKWGCAETHAGEIIRKLLDAGIPPGILINVNFPDCEADEVRETRVTVQGQREQEMLGLDGRVDGRGNPYFWLAFEKKRFMPKEGTDLRALDDNCISITPLKLDLTAEPMIATYARHFG